MSQAPVTEFVCENRNDLLCLAFLNQRVVDNDMLLPRQAEEVGVAVCTSLTSINNIELMKRELQAVSQSLNADLQVARLERRELVEQGQNGDWIHCNHKDLQTCAKQP